jgi:hypothetical protein
MSEIWRPCFPAPAPGIGNAETLWRRACEFRRRAASASPDWMVSDFLSLAQQFAVFAMDEKLAEIFPALSRRSPQES